jgi:hypothetical protein
MMEAATTLCLVVALSVSTGSCASTTVPPRIEAALASQPDALVQLRRRGCAEGGCPVFGVAIYADGEVIFDGGANVATVGRRKGALASTNLGALVDAFHNVDFIDTPEHCCDCPEEPRSTRAGQIVIDYRPGGVEKEIFLHERCRGLPQGLRMLVDAIENLTPVRSWIGATPSPTGDLAASRPPG